MSCISTFPSSIVSLPAKTVFPADSGGEPLQASTSSDDDASSYSGGSGQPDKQNEEGPASSLIHFENGNEAEMLTDRSDQQHLVLYWTSGFGSPPCMRLMIALAEKHLLERTAKIHINLLTGENRTPDVKKLNPRMQVPILKIGNIVICESLASCLFIEDEFKDHGNMLVPHNALLKAKVLQRCIESLNLETKTRDIVLPLQNWLPPDLRQPIDPLRIKAAKENLANELNFWGKNVMEDLSSDFLVGSSFSLADAVFFPSLAWLVHYGLDLSQHGWENLNRYYNAVKDRPSVQASWPPTWSVMSPIGDLRMFNDIAPSLSTPSASPT